MQQQGNFLTASFRNQMALLNCQSKISVKVSYVVAAHKKILK